MTNKWLASSTDEGWASIWDIASGQCQWKVQNKGIVIPAASPDGKWIALLGKSPITRIVSMEVWRYGGIEVCYGFGKMGLLWDSPFARFYHDGSERCISKKV